MEKNYLQSWTLNNNVFEIKDIENDVVSRIEKVKKHTYCVYNHLETGFKYRSLKKAKQDIESTLNEVLQVLDIKQIWVMDGHQKVTTNAALEYLLLDEDVYNEEKFDDMPCGKFEQLLYLSIRYGLESAFGLTDIVKIEDMPEIYLESEIEDTDA
jgi:hypothetical protein